jgi:hypothetical protein
MDDRVLEALERFAEAHEQIADELMRIRIMIEQERDCDDE